MNFVGKKIGLSLHKFGQKVKDEFSVGNRSATGKLAANTAAAQNDDEDEEALPPEPDGLRDLIKARAPRRSARPRRRRV